MKQSKICPILLFLLLTCIPFVWAFQTLEITINTDKSSYLREESVTISGYVVTGITPHQNRLVTLWVKSPSGSAMISLITVKTGENGDFNFVFRLPPNAEFGMYKAYASISTEDENATSHTTFGVATSTQPSGGETLGNQQTPAPAPTLFVFIASLVVLGVILSALLYITSGTGETRELHAVPREDVDEKHKKCIKCGKSIPSFYTFCPYCYAYQEKAVARAPQIYGGSTYADVEEAARKDRNTEAERKAKRLEDEISALREEAETLRKILNNPKRRSKNRSMDC